MRDGSVSKLLQELLNFKFLLPALITQHSGLCTIIFVHREKNMNTQSQYLSILTLKLQNTHIHLPLHTLTFPI